MEQFLWFLVGFVAALIVVRGWILWALNDASRAYDRALKLNDETRRMLGEEPSP